MILFGVYLLISCIASGLFIGIIRNQEGYDDFDDMMVYPAGIFVGIGWPVSTIVTLTYFTVKNYMKKGKIYEFIHNSTKNSSGTPKSTKING